MLCDKKIPEWCKRSCPKECTYEISTSSGSKVMIQVFIRPSSDGTYYGMVMSVRPSVTVFRTFLLHALTY